MTKELNVVKKTDAPNNGDIKPRTRAVKKENVAVDNDRVGTILYNERMKKKLSLADISKVLCIRRVYLEAIEKGNYGDLPSMPYSAGFVDSYAKYLGLNHIRIAQLFREEINVKPSNLRAIIAEEIPVEAGLPSKVYVAAGIILALIIGGIWALLSPSKSNSNEDMIVNNEIAAAAVPEVEYFENEKIEQETVETPDTPNEEKNSNSETITSGVDENPGTEEVSDSSPERQVEVKITKENTWIEVRDAQKVYISKVLKVGEKYRLPDVKGLSLSAGKYYGVEIYVDGKLTPLLQRNKKLNIDIDQALKSNH